MSIRVAPDIEAVLGAQAEAFGMAPQSLISAGADAYPRDTSLIRPRSDGEPFAGGWLD